MKKYLETLNDKQLEAVLHTGSPLLILAGAGSGKTRVITTKIAYLINEIKIIPNSILAVTFTNKAAQEMKTRVENLCPEAEKIMIRTFHSFGAWLLRLNSHILGLNNNFVIYDDNDKLVLLKSIFEANLKDKFPTCNLKKLADNISRAKDQCISPDNNLSIIDKHEDFHILYSLYNEKLKQIGNVDFGDLIMLTVKLLKENNEIKRRTQQRFRVILVDEFQDSNPAQLDLLKELYDYSNYLCVVGDEDQSIYKFRGAEVKNIIEFPEIFPNTQIIMLEQNYRSTPNILDVALAVVNKNQYRMGKHLWTDSLKGERVKLAFVSDQDAEANICVQILQQNANITNTAILYRNNYQSRTFETLFKNSGIPYRIVGSLRFYEREEVKDILAWLTIIINPKDEVAFTRIINKPSRGLGKKSIERILKKNEIDLINSTVAIINEGSKKIANSLKDFIVLYKTLLKTIETETLSKTIEYIYSNTRLFDYYKERDSANFTSKVQNLYELVNAAASYPSGITGITDFLENVSLNGQTESYIETNEIVTLLTMHNTKGLEFDRVIITGLEDGLFPHFSSTEDNITSDIEEERRLFYVAITRARKELYLLSCKYRRIFGNYKECCPSRFLQEIPEDLLEIYGISHSEYYNVGDFVRHSEYGHGKIIEKRISNNNILLIVKFEGDKIAQLMPKYSKLERINYDD